MLKEGFQSIANIDSSPTCIDILNSRILDEFPNSFSCNFNILDQLMDVREMNFADETFDVVIDKGLLDTILVLKLNKVQQFQHFKFWQNARRNLQSSEP